MRLRYLSCFATALTLLLPAAPVQGQDLPEFETGLKPFGSYHGGNIDSVSVTNSNLTLHVPLFSWPQRGGKLTKSLAIIYNNKAWKFVTTCGHFTGECTTRVVWQGNGVSIADPQSIFGSAMTCPGATGGTVGISAVQTALGDKHPLGNTGQGYYMAIDGSGIRYVPLVSPLVTTDRNGIRYFTPYDSSIEREDTNGNQIYGNANDLNERDTLDRQFPVFGVTSDTVGCPAGQRPVSGASVLSVPGPGGTTSQIKTCYAIVPLATKFGNYGVVDQEYIGSAVMIQSVVLHNGSSWATSQAWSFEYDSRDPGDPASINYGDLTKITFPTGGTISYVWAMMGGVEQPSRAVVSRTVDANDGTGPHTWTYTPVSNVISGTNTITDPLGNQTVHTVTFLGNGQSGYVTMVKYYQGTSTSGTLLRTETTDYSYTFIVSTRCSPSGAVFNVFPIRVTTTLPDGKVSKVETDYDVGSFTYNNPNVAYSNTYTGSFGNVLAERRYDYGSGAPGPLVSQTINTYVWTTNSAYKTYNLLDLVATTTIKDGSGIQKAKTIFGYDEYGTYPLQSSGITTQHNLNPVNGTTRGNQTTVQHWVNTSGAFLLSSSTFFDTGTVKFAKDPLLHQTEFAYSSSFAGAYPTTITNALGHITTNNYDFNTGLLTSTTDPNSRTVSYTYDSLFRLTQTDFPDTGRTTFTYQDASVPFSVMVTKRITSSVNLVATAVVDGVGRVKQTQLNSNPGCTVKVDTTYDVLGRKNTVSNPYCTTGEATYGITKFKYDALGRTTRVIPPDGNEAGDTNVVKTDYLGNTVTVTDQAGKQRRSYADGLGRMVRVDEPGPVPGGTPGTGSVNITGTEQSVLGGEWVEQCALWDMEGYCLEWEWVWQEQTYWDYGGVSITVNGATKTVGYGQGSTGANVAASMAAAINADANYPVTASGNGSVVNLTSKAGGQASNYPLSAGSYTSDPAHFSAPSFVPVPSGSTLTGGTSGGLSLTTPAVTVYTYDTLDNLTCAVQKGTDTAAFTTCAAAPVAWRPRSFTYNSLSQLLTATNPESGTISYSYDADGNLLTKVAPAPNQTGSATVTTSFVYDGLHRLNKKSYSDATPLTRYSYDGVAFEGCASALSTVDGIGRRTAMCDGAGTESWSYNLMGQVVIDRRTTNSVTKDFTYGYNLAGGVISVAYPTGRTITYAYNTAAQPVSAIDVTNGINYATGALYTAAGGLASLTNGASLVSTYFYNTRLQPCRISVKFSGSGPANCGDTVTGNVLDFSYGFNLGTANNGNVASIANNRATTRSQTFTYDELNRIKTAQTQATTGQYCWGETFGYDIWANLLTIGGIQPTYNGCTQENLGVIATTKNQISGYGYDAAGNMTTNPGVGTYTYDAENRMTATAGVTYTYDGDGKRVKKSSGKLYWYGMSSDAMLETDAAGNTPMEFIFFGGKRIARRDSGGVVSYFFADHLGTSRVVTNATGGAPEESDYYPFGGERVVTDALPDQNYKFTGKERDGESGLDFFIARHYASNLGRFLQPDEFTGGPVDAFSSNDPTPDDALPYADIANPQSLNKYAYTYNNPVCHTDPNGHQPDDLVSQISELLRDPDLTMGIGAGAARFLACTLNGLGAVLEPQGKFIPLPAMPTFNENQESIADITDVTLTVFALVSGMPSKSSPAAVTLNRQRGLQFQDAVFAEVAATDARAVQDLHLKTQTGTRTVMDVVSKDTSGNVVLTEAKGSAVARLTRSQARAHPEIARTGGTVAGKGKPGYPSGTKIPPTKVKVVRPKHKPKK